VAGRRVARVAERRPARAHRGKVGRRAGGPPLPVPSPRAPPPLARRPRHIDVNQPAPGRAPVAAARPRAAALGVGPVQEAAAAAPAAHANGPAEAGAAPGLARGPVANGHSPSNRNQQNATGFPVAFCCQRLVQLLAGSSTEAYRHAERCHDVVLEVVTTAEVSVVEIVLQVDAETDLLVLPTTEAEA
jgi:hypothetical protein